MAEIIVEPEKVVLNGTDEALPTGKASVDVVVTGRGSASREVTESLDRRPSLQRVLAGMQAEEDASDAAGKEPAPVDEPAEPAEATPAEAETPEATPAEAGTSEAETPDVAALRADLDAARAEVATLRNQSGLPEVTEDDRVAWIDDPLAGLRSLIASRFGLPADHKVVDTELDYLQRELTVRAIGDSNVTDDLRAKLASERSDRQWRLSQQARQVERTVAVQRRMRDQVATAVGRAFEAVRDKHPHLAVAADIDGRPVPELVMDVYLGAVQSGLIKRDASDAEAISEALRLSEQIATRRLEPIRRHFSTAPATGPAPTEASASGSTVKGAPQSASSKPPAKTAAQPARTLSAKQAAAAPVAKAATAKRTIVEIDPADRDARQRRAIEIAERMFSKK